MGIYLHPGEDNFIQAKNSRIYVDKTGLVSYTNAVIETADKYICVSRPRRFGKTMAANMLAAYYDCQVDGREVFDGLEISNYPDFELRRNKYDVIFVNAQNFLSKSASIKEMLLSWKKEILWELLKTYPECEYYDKEDISRSMMDIYQQTKRGFVILIDEWDCVFREKKSADEQEQYLDFLRDWLKDKAYVSLAYMTGILPIKKYGTHSALNMFNEFSMENPGELAQYVGFTEDEVKALCAQYNVDFDECKAWYDGYAFRRQMSIYSPRSVVSLMLNGEFQNYWNQTETYEALKIYISMNFDGLRDKIIAMMAYEHIAVDTGSFSNDMVTFERADDILTLLIHLGYLGYNAAKGETFIPNREIMQEFVTTTSTAKWNEIINSITNSEDLLKATWEKNTEKVAAYIETAHLETAHIQYNDENALSYTISLAYYFAREYYTMVREFPTGKGFADIVFLPRSNHSDKPALLVELKWDKTAYSAIRQIEDKNYRGKLDEFGGDIILVGINYNKKTKEHTCEIKGAGHR